jgi:hypothetical protein
MSAPLPLGDRRELFVDRVLIDRLEGLSLKLHEPVPSGRMVGIDKPWEGPINGPSVLFLFEGRYHAYYRGMTLRPDDDSGRLCVAVSEDGVNWTKPELGLVAWEGRNDTNIVAFEGRSGMVSPWLDTRPGVPAGERIKAIASEPLAGGAHTAFMDPAGAKRLVFWASGDGFAFRRMNPQPELVSNLLNCFDGGNTMFWSEAEQQYVVYYRWFDAPWGSGRRSVARSTSKDLMTWSEPVGMAYGDSPREQFYTNNTEPYFRAPHIYIAPAARFMEKRRVVTDGQAQAIGLKSIRNIFFGNDCSDGVLLTSRAGAAHYDRTFMETFIRPGPGYENWVTRTNYPFTGIVPFGRDRMMMAVHRHYMQDTWHAERLLMRLDGFASVNAPWAGGEMITRPFTFSGQALEINYRTGAPGFVRVEIQSAEGAPLPGFALEDGPEIIGDEMSRVVAWKTGPDVSALSGKPVRLRFAMKDADLFSLRFQNTAKDV